MPKFVVTTKTDDEVTHDTVDFSTDKAATDNVQLALADKARERMPNGSRASFAATVEDESGKEIYRASLDFRAQTAVEIQAEEQKADEALQELERALSDLGKPPN